MGVYGYGYIRKVSEGDLIIRESFKLTEEIDNFNKLFESIDILKENAIVINEDAAKKTLWERIKGLWKRFTDWVKRVWNNIFHRHKVTATNAEDAKNNFNTAYEAVQKATPEQVEAVQQAKAADTSSLDNTKSEVINNIQNRHDDANKEIEKSVRNIKANEESQKETSKKIDELNDLIDQVAVDIVKTEPNTEKKTKVKVAPKIEKKQLEEPKYDFIWLDCVSFLTGLRKEKFDRLKSGDCLISNSFINIDLLYGKDHSIVISGDKENISKEINDITKIEDEYFNELVDYFSDSAKINDKHSEKGISKESYNSIAQIYKESGTDSNIKDAMEFVEDAIKYIDGVLKILQSKIDNPDSVKSGLKHIYNDETVEKLMAADYPKLIAKDIQNLNKLLVALNQYDAALKKVLDNHIEVYNKATNLMVKPVK